MNAGGFYVGLAIAAGLVILASEVAPQLVNWLLVVLIASVVLMRWGQLRSGFTAVVGLAGRAV